jgi:hypothetical protein
VVDGMSVPTRSPWHMATANPFSCTISFNGFSLGAWGPFGQTDREHGRVIEFRCVWFWKFWKAESETCRRRPLIVDWAKNGTTHAVFSFHGHTYIGIQVRHAPLPPDLSAAPASLVHADKLNDSSSQIGCLMLQTNGPWRGARLPGNWQYYANSWGTSRITLLPVSNVSR